MLDPFWHLYLLSWCGIFDHGRLTLALFEGMGQQNQH